jgi:flagellar biosynthesis protein FliR
MYEPGYFSTVRLALPLLRLAALLVALAVGLVRRARSRTG